MLEQIGFYTLSDKRARAAWSDTQMQRVEIILISGCNFKCPYCRGLQDGLTGVMPFENACKLIDYWTKDQLANIRFSGGEPTLYPRLVELVAYAKSKGVKRIAISTNGSAKLDLYQKLIAAGVNDFSISLDACCASTGDKMAGDIKGAWGIVIANIRELSKLTYTTVGIVLTDDNLSEVESTIMLAHNLGVADIRVISAAQSNMPITFELPQEVLDAHPILKYRWTNIKAQRNMRGLKETDSHRCPLVLDDAAVAGKFHFPCIIYLREQGKPIGTIGPNMREDRKKWFLNTDTHKDPICKANCLDVCVDYNNTWIKHKLSKVALPHIDPSVFDQTHWRIGNEFLVEFGMECRFKNLTSPLGKQVIRKYAVGWAHGDQLPHRPKPDTVGVMYFKDGREFWTHLRANEFYEIFKHDELNSK